MLFDQAPLPAGLFVLDPPWTSDAGGGGKGAQEHYRLSCVADVAAFIVGDPEWQRTPQRLVWMWVTSLADSSGEALDLVRALGLHRSSKYIWWKGDVDGEGEPVPDPKMGIGQWGRCEHEELWVCRSGTIGRPNTAHVKLPRSVIIERRREHSRKPEKAWGVIETVSGAVGVVGAMDDRLDTLGHKGVEFFAREARPGWLARGDQAPAP